MKLSMDLLLPTMLLTDVRVLLCDVWERLYKYVSEILQDAEVAVLRALGGGTLSSVAGSHIRRAFQVGDLCVVRARVPDCFFYLLRRIAGRSCLI